MPFPPGKLPLDALDRLLSAHATPSDPRVLIGARVGCDAAVIDFGDMCLVAKTDPITFATDEIGYYAVHVNANDIAAMGAIPRWFLATLLLPEKKTDEALVASIFASLREAAQAIGVSLCGGHTEITGGLDRPIVVGQMLGEALKSDLVHPGRLAPGDCILLTKGLGIEATAILAREKAAALSAAGISDEAIARAALYLRDPGISILKEARIACTTARVKAMHDPTEGGVATALREMAHAARVGLSVDGDALFASDDTRQICAALGLDAFGVISSGALLIGVGEADAERVCQAIQEAGISCAAIARAEPAVFGMKLRRGNIWTDLPIFDRDEIGKV